MRIYTFVYIRIYMHMNSHCPEVKIIPHCVIKTFHLYKYNIKIIAPKNLIKLEMFKVLRTQTNLNIIMFGNSTFYKLLL